MLVIAVLQNLFAKSRKKATKILQNSKNNYTFALANQNKVPWMSGLVSGLQNRVRRFESARNLKKLRNREAFFVYLCLVAREYELLNKFLVESGGIA